MPQDNSVTREQLVTALVEQIKSGGADALGFDSLLKERAADQWNDLRKEAIDGFVDKKIQEAMKGYINRVFQIAGLIGIVMLGFLATKLINMTQSTDIASQIIDQLKNNKNSEIARSLEDTIAYFNKLKSDADSNFSYAVNSVESVKQEANKLNGKLTSYEKTQIALDQISNELTISQNTAQEVIKKSRPIKILLQNYRERKLCRKSC